MATLKLTDSLGFVVEVETHPDASIAKYFRDNVSLNLRESVLNLQNTTLQDFPLTSVRTGLEVEQDVEIGNETELTLSAGLTAGFTVFKNEGEAVFTAPFEEDAAIEVGANQAYLSFDINPALSAGLTTGRGDLSFGFEAGTEISIANYRPFSLSDSGPLLADALRDTIVAFTIPGDVEDLAAMPAATIVAIDGSASLSFTAGLEASASPVPLATVDAPDPLGEIKVNVGASVGIQSSYTVRGDFQLRVRKLSAQTLEFGYYKTASGEIKVGVSGSVGVSVGTGSTDFAGGILGAISSDAKVDEDELKKAGLDTGRIQAIKDAVEAGIDRSLELGLTAEFSTLRADSAAFLYEVDLGALSQDGHQAVRDALDGDLTALTAPDNELPAGVKIKTSIFKNIRQKKTSIKINLLGIFNFISVTKLLVAGEVLYNHETGELVLTDKATAERIRATLHNFAADPEKLHKVQMESFLFTAAYRGTKLAVGSPSLKSTHSYFELHARTNHQTMKDNLDVAEALRLMSTQDKAQLLEKATDFGRSTLYAETGYENALLTKLFLDADGRPQPKEFYEQAGREALDLLYQSNDPDGYRRRPALDDELWKKMTAAGSAQNLMALFPKLNDVQKNVVDSDYRVIVWWAAAMHKLAKGLVEVNQFFADHPDAAPGDNALRKVRKRFRKKVAAVAKTTKKQFGDPWGLIAMDVATGHQAAANVRFTGDVISYYREREPTEGVPV